MRVLGVKQLALVAGILGVTVALSALTADVTKGSEPGIRLVNGQLFLPDSVGRWIGGQPEGLTEAEKEVLPPDTGGIRRRYTRPDGGEVTCSVILAGRDVTSIHRPELCLPAQGWNIQWQQVENIPVPHARGGVLKVMRLDAIHTAAKTDGNRRARAVFVYWFVGKNRVTPHHWERIWGTIWDRVLHNVNPRWAYILIATGIQSDETPQGLAGAQTEAMRAIGEFVAGLYPLLCPTPSRGSQG
ncbi:MAG: EpsI family protein [Verrucomicrobiae bacterium]|nr:EpsI family protein [Verrucomicrobiae bacterium]